MSTETKKFKEGDRVKQAKRNSCLGVVKEIREETTGSSGEVDNKALMVKVLWDNGTFSYFAPDALEIAG